MRLLDLADAFAGAFEAKLGFQRRAEIVDAPAENQLERDELLCLFQEDLRGPKKRKVTLRDSEKLEHAALATIRDALYAR